ncbi:hypothetical protein QUB05_07205 [Microcoleus sp. F10-C6]|uniref:hypothetical protein n=1 Tax=unclassified Microcoleus TaxID=2642155 RepID=UPI002FD397C4
MSENTDLLIECLQLQAENRRLNEQLKQIKNLTIEMFAEFKNHRPHGILTENSRESIRLNAGGTIYFVQYVDRTGKSYISTEGFTPEGDIAPKLFYFGFAVLFLVEELTRQGFSCLPERFSKLFDRNPKFMSYIIKEFERVLSI